MPASRQRRLTAVVETPMYDAELKAQVEDRRKRSKKSHSLVKTKKRFKGMDKIRRRLMGKGKTPSNTTALLRQDRNR